MGNFKESAVIQSITCLIESVCERGHLKPLLQVECLCPARVWHFIAEKLQQNIDLSEVYSKATAVSFCVFVFLFETGFYLMLVWFWTCYMAEANLRLLVLLYPSSGCCDYRHITPWQALCDLLKWIHHL